MINAFATDHPIQGGKDVSPGPSVVLLGGMGVAVSFIGAAAGIAMLDRSETTLRFAFHDLGRQIIERSGGLASDEVAQLRDRTLASKADRLTRSGAPFSDMARAMRHSMLMHIIAHEVGHIALGHTLGTAPNPDVSRNQEREADSFASSVISSCPYREYHFLGELLTKALFVWMHRGGGKAAESHPHARERFNNAFVNNSQAAGETSRAFGWDQRRLAGLLPLTD